MGTTAPLAAALILGAAVGVSPQPPEKRGEGPERYKRRHDNPLWQVLKRELADRR